jgi:3'-phosphoadenosine 5'-phosphosulfate sulfotransferase (PAPS reductase)/FAD synthetase
MALSPYRIDGPAVISFSGGRTSALMLQHILTEGLQPDVHVLFANTGKERPETLDFIHEIETRWPVQVHWLERRPFLRKSPFADRYRVVDYATADREGRTFLQLVIERRRLPNPRIRMCTTELKIRVMKHWMMAQGYTHWDMIIGLRADEPRRVANQRKLNAKNKERWIRVMPMAEAGHTLADVEAFWAQQPFQLQLQPHEGNCDLCFLKSLWKKQQIARDRPDLLPWWIEREAQIGQPFRRDQPAYIKLQQVPIDTDTCESEVDCHCTD